MKYIRDYLERLFAKLPQTPELLAEKERMLQAAEQEFAALKAQGLSEAQAVRKILNDFANVDDLAHQYINQNDNSSAYQSLSLPVMEQNRAKDLLKAGKTNALLKGLGVFVILFGIAVGSFLEQFEDSFWLGFLSDLLEIASVFLIFAGIAVGIVLLVQSKKWLQQLRQLSASCYLAPSGEQVLGDFVTNAPNPQRMLLIGILLLIATPFVGGLFSMFPFGLGIYLQSTAEILLVAAGIFLLIYRYQIKKLIDSSSEILYHALRCSEEA